MINVLQLGLLGELYGSIREGAKPIKGGFAPATIPFNQP
jgi:hypothetical protein